MRLHGNNGETAIHPRKASTRNLQVLYPKRCVGPSSLVVRTSFEGGLLSSAFSSISGSSSAGESLENCRDLARCSCGRE